ncbi:MAG: hypothetical protein SFW65_06135 [Alphaproteobacteria bacterium]|nr:hypothetical protein [Alphaproteobacteria bacterium]
MTPRRFSIDKRVPLALMFTVLLQLGGVVWWASFTQAQDNFRDVRLHELEMRHNKDIEKQDHILERLTRLEAHSDMQLELLQRVDAFIRKK